MTPDEFLSAQQVEDDYHIKAATLRYWASRNEGPASFKLGRRRVWRRSAVEAWIAAQEQATATGGDAA